MKKEGNRIGVIAALHRGNRIAIAIVLGIAALVPGAGFTLRNTKAPTHGSGGSQQNHAPIVTILHPKTGDDVEESVPVRYQISVVDKEDGDSKFQEINDKEIFLKVIYFADAAKAAEALNQMNLAAGTQSNPGTEMNSTGKKNLTDPRSAQITDPAGRENPKPGKTDFTDLPGLAMIKESNCLNCHAFKTKLIGPSFYDIARRYAYSRSNADTLVKRIREGTAGVWGTIKMPTHPELTTASTAAIVEWILQKATDPAVNYYSGAEGSLRITRPAASSGKVAFLLMADYTDHGLSDKTGPRLRGQDAVVLKIK